MNMNMSEETKNRIASVLYDSVCENGLLPTLQAVFGRNISISIKLEQTMCSAPIELLELSARGDHALHRSSCRTVADLVEILGNNDISRLRNVGKKTVSEIKSKLLIYCYENMSRHARMAFLADLAERNFAHEHHGRYVRVSAPTFD